MAEGLIVSGTRPKSEGSEREKVAVEPEVVPNKSKANGSGHGVVDGKVPPLGRSRSGFDSRKCWPPAIHGCVYRPDPGANCGIYDNRLCATTEGRCQAGMSTAPSDLRGALPAGTVVGEYKVEAILGHGGYSVVYRARHVELERIVALKEYLPADLSIREQGTVFPRSADCTPHYEDGKRRFLEEAKRIVEFNDDPGVITCLGYFRSNGTAYLVLEHVAGMSLATLLRQREAAGRPLDERELRSLVLPLLETLSRLHKADVLHRDIKPSNILIRRSDGKPVLIDFGAAKQHAALHSKSIAPYTEGYAAWEQVGEGDLGPWTDVYAMGAVMWRVVAGGKPPWDPPNPKKVELRAAAVLSGKPDPLPSAAELGEQRFSSELLATIDRCLTILVPNRIGNCDDLSRLIEKVGIDGDYGNRQPHENQTISAQTVTDADSPSGISENEDGSRSNSDDVVVALSLLALWFLVFFLIEYLAN